MEATAAQAVAPATEAAPSAPAANEGSDGGFGGLDALLGGLSDAEIAGDAGEGGEQAPETPETPDAQTQPGKKGAPDELIFSDEQLKTPDGIRRARDRVVELRKMQHKAYLDLKAHERNVIKKTEKLRAKVQSFRSEKSSHDLLLNNVRSNLQGLHSNDPDTILTALGNLTGTDGLKAYELLTSRVVNKGRPTLDPQVQQLLEQQQKQIEELRGVHQQREVQEVIRQKSQQINAHTQRIGEMIRSSTTTPHLTRVFNDDPVRLTKFIVDAITENNGAIPASQLFAEMERELQGHFGGPPQTGTSGGTAPKQPAAAQSSPGRSIGPSTAAQSTTRIPSEEESLRALANDTELLSSLGL